MGVKVKYLKVFPVCELPSSREALLLQPKFLGQTLRSVHLPWEKKKKKKDARSIFAKAQSSSELSKQKKGRTGPSIIPPHHRKMSLRMPRLHRSVSLAHVFFNYFAN